MVSEKQSRWKGYVKEVVLGIAAIFIFSNIINYIRAPKLENDHFVLPPAHLIDGTTYRYKEGKPVILHFWGTWCPICRMEANNIDRLARSYEVITVAVNSQNVETVRTYMREHGLHYRVINDPEGKLAAQYRVEVFPTTFIFDTVGKLRFTLTGYTTSAGLTARMKML
ncbi:thioredoxin, putative [hydrothermal vent metagenome]|uniref:Thioredoxin, putative n=1 Tax=hydrothermal vent metagenome TaxID=652676 RepID=A0A1W1EAD5_9ZZZZ